MLDGLQELIVKILLLILLLFVVAVIIHETLQAHGFLSRTAEPTSESQNSNQAPDIIKH